MQSRDNEVIPKNIITHKKITTGKGLFKKRNIDWLIEEIEQNSQLGLDQEKTILDLSAFKLSGNAIKEISEKLEDNKSITCLKLNIPERIHTDPTASICLMLRTNTTLTELKISRATDSMAQEIALAMRTNNKLTNIDLRNNSCKSIKYKAELATTLKYFNTALTDIKMDFEPISVLPTYDNFGPDNYTLVCPETKYKLQINEEAKLKRASKNDQVMEAIEKYLQRNSSISQIKKTNVTQQEAEDYREAVLTSTKSILSQQSGAPQTTEIFGPSNKKLQELRNNKQFAAAIIILNSKGGFNPSAKYFDNVKKIFTKDYILAPQESKQPPSSTNSRSISLLCNKTKDEKGR